MTTRSSGGLPDALREGLEGAQERLGEAQEKLARTAREVRERGEEAWEDLTVYVRKNPGKTALFCIGIGLLAGLFLNRPSRD